MKGIKTQEKAESDEKFLALNAIENKWNNKNGKATERQTVNKTAIKFTTETTIRLQESPT